MSLVFRDLDGPRTVPGRTQDSPGKDLAEKGPFGSEKDVPGRIWPRKALLLAKRTSGKGFGASRRRRPTLADLARLARLTDSAETAEMSTIKT